MSASQLNPELADAYLDGLAAGMQLADAYRDDTTTAARRPRNRRRLLLVALLAILIALGSAMDTITVLGFTGHLQHAMPCPTEDSCAYSYAHHQGTVIRVTP